MIQSEYPKKMNHPSFEPGRIGREVTSKLGFAHYVGGTPIRFPPVIVNGPDDEAYYASRGYVAEARPGTFAPTPAGPTRAPYVRQEYPKWVNGTLVNNEDEHLALLEGKPPEGQVAPKPEPDPDILTPEQQEIAALKKRVEELLEEKRAAVKPIIPALSEQLAEVERREKILNERLVETLAPHQGMTA